MKLIYFYRVPLPDARADAIQIVNTCAGVARAGGEVRLYVESVASPTEECLRFYGLALPGQIRSGGFRLVALGRHWSWPLLNLRVGRTFRAAARGRSCLFVREVRPYVPILIAKARACGMPVIFEAHNVSSALVEEKREKGATEELVRKATERSALEASVLRAVDGVVCTQNATAEGLKHLWRPGIPVTVLGNGTQLPRPRDAATDAARDIDILYCGSLKAWKGVDGLVEAMRRLAPYRLLIVGPHYSPDVERVREAARVAGVAERVTIRPSVSPAEVWNLYARAKVGVIPLPGRGFVEARDFTSPLKLFEMMAAELPIVATRVPSLVVYVDHGRDAVLVSPDDPAALADGILEVLEDRTLARRLASSARARVAGRTWDERGRKLLEFAEEVAGRA